MDFLQSSLSAVPTAEHQTAAFGPKINCHHVSSNVHRRNASTKRPSLSSHDFASSGGSGSKAEKLYGRLSALVYRTSSWLVLLIRAGPWPDRPRVLTRS